MAEHDQRFKNLIRECLFEFVSLFFPFLADLLDLRHLAWEDKEVFADPPRGDVYILDLVARVPSLADPDETNLLHIEVESRDAVATFRPRVYNYYHFLRHKNNCRVVTLAVYLRVGLDGIGIDSYTEEVDGLEALRFQFRYVGFPKLDAAAYVVGSNWLGVALSSLMQIPPQRKAWLRAEALRRLLMECPENNYRRFLLVECVEAYLELDAEQQQEYQRLLMVNPYKEIVPMMQTTFEKGMEKGMEKGEEKALRRTVEKLLTKRFGPLSDSARQNLERLSIEKLDELVLAVLDAPSLEALGLTN